ncbi:MAG: cell wall-binding repeat-containing protein [Erysipelotrichaceae bacterium]|nr:cell wall-binding repeat-containing protein [Erysipelotrichaceae bacterium]
MKTLWMILIIAFLISAAFPVFARADDHLSEERHMAETLQAGSGESVHIAVSADKVTISLNDIGSDAQLARLSANEYFEGDPYTGLSDQILKSGTVLGTFSGTQVTEFSRYQEDGTDSLYSKYYLIRDGKIADGPYYATEVASERSAAPFPMATKKGLIHEDSSTYALAEEMGISHTVINLDLGSLILRKEDDNGDPVDNTGAIEFESNGETFYFDKSYIRSIDRDVKKYTDQGINVTMVVIAWASTPFTRYPSSLVYTKNNNMTMAFNTSNGLGLRYFIAAMEFLADRYSQKSVYGLADKFIIGNEIDYAYDWCMIMPRTWKDSEGVPHMNRADFDVFMEEYARGLRMADLAVKKYNSEAEVLISLTHNWAQARWDTSIPDEADWTVVNGKKVANAYYNSYAPKEMLDWLSTVDKARGDYNWGVSFHPYPVGTSSNIPSYTDLNMPNTEPMTGDWKTTPWVTVTNLEIYQQYFEQPVNMYNGTALRDVILTETSICSSSVDGTPDSSEPLIYHQDTDEYENRITGTKYSSAEMTEIMLKRQAATIAAYYYRTAQLPCISEIAYFQPHDQVSHRLGLMDVDGNKKPAYDLWKYVDTNLTFKLADRYLPYLNMYYTDPDRYQTFYELMDLTDSGYWNRISESDFSNNIIRRIVEEENTVTRLSGKLRYDTSIRIADELRKVLGADKFDNIVLATGENFADALGGGYLAAKKNAPILLTKPSQANKINTYINENLREGGTVYILGGTGALPEECLTGLNSSFRKERLYGKTRYDTSLAILNAAGVDDEPILIATGKSSADSLSASALGLPMLLVDGKKDSLNEKQKDFLQNHSSNAFYVLGGNGAVSDSIEAEISSIHSVSRIKGSTRYETTIEIARTFYPSSASAVLAAARDKEFPDGLCAGPLAYALKAPILLTNDGKEDKAAAYASSESIHSGYITGGAARISDDTAKKIFGAEVIQ